MSADKAGPVRSWREWWSGEPSLRRHPLRWLVWLTDEALDSIPIREDGRWYRRSGLGCRLRLQVVRGRRERTRQEAAVNDWLCHECKKKPDAPHRSWCSKAVLARERA